METLQTENEVYEAVKTNAEFSFAVKSLQLTHIPSAPFVRRSLIQNTCLQSLEIIFEEERQDWKFAADIIKNKKLRKLSLRIPTTDHTDPDFKYFCESLKENCTIENLHLFNVLQMEENVEQFCEGLDSNTSIQRLSIFSIEEDIFHQFARTFMDNKTVKQLRVWEHKIDPTSIANIIKYNDTLTSISFSLSKLNSIGEQLISALRLNTTLRKIVLEGKRNGVLSITQGLKRNFSLRKITFWGLEIEDEQLIRELIEEMKNKIEHLTVVYSKLGTNLDLLRELVSVKTFKTLKLVSCYIIKDQVHTIGESLKTNQNLTHLDLSTSRITEEEIPPLVEGLKINKTLTRLNLTECEMTSETAPYLAEILRCNSTLRDLNLDNNNFSTDALKVISNALTYNKTLLRLHIRHDYMNNTLPAFIEQLKVNKSLECLHLMYDPNDTKSVQEFCEVIKHNTTLTELILLSVQPMDQIRPEPDPGWSVTKAFQDIFITNRSLTKFKVRNYIGEHINQRFDVFTEENKRRQIEFMKGMKVLTLNIKNSSYALQLLPLELWSAILSQLDYPGIKSVRSMVESICN